MPVLAITCLAVLVASISIINATITIDRSLNNEGKQLFQ